MGKFVKNDGTKIPIGTILFDGARVHLSDAHTSNGTDVTIYEMTLTFKGKNVTVSGCTKVVGGAYITAVEGTIYQVIGY